MFLQATLIILMVVTTRTISNLCKKAKVMLSFRKARRRFPGTIELEAMFKFKMIGNNQHGFTMAQPCLTSLIFFCDEISGSVDKARAVDVICFGFSKALHGILVA